MNTWGKVNERGIPARPKEGWYTMKVDLGLLLCGNPYKEGTEDHQKFEKKWLSQPAEARTIVTNGYLYKYGNKWFWTECGVLDHTYGKKVKVLGTRRINSLYQPK